MTNKEKRRQEWASRIADYRTSGLTMAAWCSSRECSTEQLKYWLRKFKNASVSESASVPVGWTAVSTSDTPPLTSSKTVIVQVGLSRIEVQPGFDPFLLRSVVKALQPLC